MNHVFVDFENVPNVDLALIRDRAADVTLLIGEKQRRIDLELVRQIHAHATQVTLIEVGASGRNALDLVLAWHLGHAAERYPGDMFFVVSKDKDFDPLIKHLRSRGLEVARVDAFDALPFLGAKKTELRHASAPRGSRAVQTRPASADAAPRPRADQRADARTAAEDARFAKLIDRLQHKTKARPVRRKTLVSHINGFYGNSLSPSELEAVVQSLESDGIIALDAQGRVSYPHQAASS